MAIANTNTKIRIRPITLLADLKVFMRNYDHICLFFVFLNFCFWYFSSIVLVFLVLWFWCPDLARIKNVKIKNIVFCNALALEIAPTNQKFCTTFMCVTSTTTWRCYLESKLLQQFFQLVSFSNNYFKQARFRPEHVYRDNIFV